MRVVCAQDDIRGPFIESGCVVIKDMFEPEEIAELMDRLKASFSASRDGTGEIKPGGRAQVLRRADAGLPRYLRMLYEPPERPIFRRLVELRNHLAGLPAAWALDGPQDGWWTAARFNQYPKGGGFMAEHTDSGYVGAVPPGGFVQPILFLTERGKDYQEGGAFMVDGDVLDVEPYCKAGDVLVYDGKISHGVMPVDPHLADDGQLSGRVVAAVTTLRVL